MKQPVKATFHIFEGDVEIEGWDFFEYWETPSFDGRWSIPYCTEEQTADALQRLYDGRRVVEPVTFDPTDRIFTYRELPHHHRTRIAGQLRWIGGKERWMYRLGGFGWAWVID